VQARNAAHRWLIIVVRVVVGVVFIYAGALKIREPLQFADNISSFSILPGFFIVPLALWLPAFEILTGALVAIGLFRQAAALGLVIISAVFLAAISSALARGLTIDCGCFGTSMPSRQRMWLDLGRDVLLLSGALVAYLGDELIRRRAVLDGP
jgi:putative oxidoreductase